MEVCYSYLRYSFSRQHKGDSLRRQMEAGAALAARHGWKMDEDTRFTDEAMSAYRGKNAAVGALSAFLADIEVGRIKKGSILVVESLDRLSRDKMSEALKVVLNILWAGVRIATVTPERIYDTDSINDNWGLMEMLIHLQRSNDESLVKSERIAASWSNRRRQAKEKGAPFGSHKPGWLAFKDGQYRLIPDRVATVQHMIGLALEGQGCTRIAHMLNSQPDRYPAWGRSGEWSQASVHYVLRSPALCGDWVRPKDRAQGDSLPEADRIRAYYPPVVDFKDFTAIQSALTGRKLARGRRGKADTNLFTGLAWSAATGRRLVVRSKRTGNNVYAYLMDNHHSETDPADTACSVPYAWFEQAVRDHITGLDLATLVGVESGATARVAELAEAERALAALDARAEALQAELTDPTQPPAVVPRLAAALRQVVADRERAVERVQNLRQDVAERPTETQAAFCGDEELLASLRPEERPRVRSRMKQRLRELLSGIWIYVQTFNKRARAVHIQLWYRAGGHSHLTALLGRIPELSKVLDLRGVDLRQGYPPRARQKRGSA